VRRASADLAVISETVVSAAGSAAYSAVGIYQLTLSGPFGN